MEQPQSGMNEDHAVFVGTLNNRCVLCGATWTYNVSHATLKAKRDSNVLLVKQTGCHGRTFPGGFRIHLSIYRAYFLVINVQLLK